MSSIRTHQNKFVLQMKYTNNIIYSDGGEHHSNLKGPAKNVLHNKTYTH